MSHNLEIQIAKHGNVLPFNLCEKKGPKKHRNKDGKSSKAKEVMIIVTILTKISIKFSNNRLNIEPKRSKLRIKTRLNLLQAIARKLIHNL